MENYQEYYPILIFLILALGLSFVLVVLPFILNKRNSYQSKVSEYECGFEAIGSTRKEFNIKFYLVAILFIIFDLEIAFLFPWAISIAYIGLGGYISMMFFLFILTIGFIYEWKKGALEWE